MRLLDAAIDYVAAHGLTDLSLRRLAAELGTSHRMLSHHFGSKEGMWVAIVHEVERQQLAAIGDLVPSASGSLADAMRAWWRHISDPVAVAPRAALLRGVRPGPRRPPSHERPPPRSRAAVKTSE